MLDDMQVFRFNFRHEIGKKNPLSSRWLQYVTTLAISLALDG